MKIWPYDMAFCGLYYRINEMHDFILVYYNSLFNSNNMYFNLILRHVSLTHGFTGSIAVQSERTDARAYVYNMPFKYEMFVC